MDSVDKLADLNESTDLNYLKTIFDNYYQKEPSFHNNPYFIKLYQELNKIKDLSLVPEAQKNYFLALFSKGISKSTFPIENKTTIKKDLFLILELEQKILDPQTNDNDRINIIQKFIDIKAIPEVSTLSHLVNLNNYTLKGMIINNYAALINLSDFLNILLNRNADYEELRLLAIKAANLRQDLPQNLFEKIIQDSTEAKIIRLTSLDLHHSELNQKMLESLALNKKEDLDLRLISLRKLFLRSSIDPLFFANLLYEKNENIVLKKNLITIFKNRISLDVIRNYFLDKNIVNEEKYELLKLLTILFKNINKDGSLNMLFILMRDHKKARKLLLNSGIIANDTLKEILLSSITSASFKTETFEYLEKILTPEALQELVIEILPQENLPLSLKKHLIDLYPKNIPLDTIIKIIINPNIALNFRIDLIKKNKNLLLKNKKTKILNALFNNKEPLILINFILKNFYPYLDEGVVNDYLLDQDLNEQLKSLLLSLKKVAFFTPFSSYFSGILKSKNLTDSDLTFFRENFLNYFSPENIYTLLQNLINKKNLVELLKSLDLNSDLKLAFISFLFEKGKIAVADKILILKEFIDTLANDLLLKLLTSEETPIELKHIIITHKPKRPDLNLKGDLDFIILDKAEDQNIKKLIVEEYREYLSPDVILAFKKAL